jgi:hypothetical protein
VSITTSPISEFDQYVGDRLAQRPAARDGQHVALPFGPRDLDQSLVIERRLGENRIGHRDGVVERQQANGIRRRIANRSKALCQQFPCGLLDFSREPNDDIVEDRKFFAGEFIPVADE